MHHVSHRILRTAFAVAALLLSVAAMPALAGTQTFCISGQSNGVGWSWGIISDGGLQSRANVAPVPAGAGCGALARAFVGSLNANANCTAKVSATNPCCFTVCCKGDFQLWVGNAAGDPDSGCPVTGNPDGCSFNPLIIQTENSDVSSPCEVGVDPVDPVGTPID